MEVVECAVEPGARYDSERIKDDLIITLHRPNSWGTVEREILQN
jgi:hypothetical protein